MFIKTDSMLGKKKNSSPLKKNFSYQYSDSNAFKLVRKDNFAKGERNLTEWLSTFVCTSQFPEEFNLL